MNPAKMMVKGLKCAHGQVQTDVPMTWPQAGHPLHSPHHEPSIQLLLQTMEGKWGNLESEEGGG